MIKNRITTIEAAKIIGVTPDYIRHMILHGKIKAEKLGNYWLLAPQAIKHIKRTRFKKEKTVDGSAE